MTGHTLNLAATADQLDVLTAFLLEIWHVADLPREARFALELALEELFVNTVTHGAEAAGHTPHVFVTVTHDDTGIGAIYEDDAPAFNPLARGVPLLDAALDERPLGGLGVHLMKNLMGSVEYEYTAGRNRISMRLR